MELLGDVGHGILFRSVWRVLVSVQDRCMVCPRHRLRKLFWTHLMVPLGDKAQVEPRFGPFGESANLDAR